MKRGYMDWDKSLLPLERLAARRDLLVRQLREENLDAVVVYGDVYAADELIELTNYGPYWCNTAAVLTSAGALHLVTGHNARVNPWICQMTGIKEDQITPAGMKVPQKTAQVLRQMFPDGAKIGIVGKYTLSRSVEALRDAGFSVTYLDSFTDGLLDLRDPAYLATVEKGHRLMEAALNRALQAVPEDATIQRFCAEVEYALRSSGAMDVVLLAATEGCAFSVPKPEQARQWNLFLNVQYLGEWLVFAFPVGGDERIYDAVDRAAAQLEVGGDPSAEVEGYEISVKARVLSDQISSLNHSGTFLARHQVISISVQDRSGGGYAEKMYRMEDTGAIALGER